MSVGKRALSVIPVFLLLAGCSGWTAGSLVVHEMERISVPYFQNDTFYRGLEEDLTNEVMARVLERPDLILVERDSAEMVLEGRIIGYEQSILAEDLNNDLVESSAMVTVLVRLTRASDGSLLKESILSDQAEFFLARGETIESAQRESFEMLSHKIVSVVVKGF